MKKAFVGILAATAAVIIGTTSAFAAAQGTGYRRNFVDADGDGICDNAGRGEAGCGRYFVDADGDGICDNAGRGGAGCGRYFIDADGDGVCDNYGNAGQGRGRGNGFRGGRNR